MEILVYSDGSATVASKPGGYGYVICFDGQKVDEGYGHIPLATNNDAELEAAIQGLAKVLKMRIDNQIPIGTHQIFLVSDSQIVLNWANGTAKFKQQAKIAKYYQLQHVMRKLNAQTRWVKGHSGDEHNERCDKLANQGRKMYDEPKKVVAKPVMVKVTLESLYKHVLLLENEVKLLKEKLNECT